VFEDRTNSPRTSTVFYGKVCYYSLLYLANLLALSLFRACVVCVLSLSRSLSCCLCLCYVLCVVVLFFRLYPLHYPLLLCLPCSSLLFSSLLLDLVVRTLVRWYFRTLSSLVSLYLSALCSSPPCCCRLRRADPAPFSSLRSPRSPSSATNAFLQTKSRTNELWRFILRRRNSQEAKGLVRINTRLQGSSCARFTG
jgi:hypothetical protein